jgi:hypothetical protein
LIAVSIAWGYLSKCKTHGMETALASLVGVEATGAFSLGCGGDGLFGFDGESLCQLFVVHLGEVTEVLGVFSGEAR